MAEQNPKFTNSARYKCLEYLKKQTFDLYLCYCGIEECDPGHLYGPTERSEYLLHYILEGKGKYYIGDKVYELGPHQAFLICPGVTTYYEADTEDPWSYLWVGFNGVKAKTYLEYLDLDDNHLIGEFPYPDLLLEQVQNILNARELTYANELKREGYLFLFFSTLIQYQHDKLSVSSGHDYPHQVYVEHALEFIEHNYNKNIKVNDIASYIGINRSYLANSFKKTMNMSPQEYLVNYRLDKASLLLRTTSLPINEIASSVGYEDPLAFSKTFKHFKGISPKLYRFSTDTIQLSSKKHEP